MLYIRLEDNLVVFNNLLQLSNLDLELVDFLALFDMVFLNEHSFLINMPMNDHDIIFHIVRINIYLIRISRDLQMHQKVFFPDFQRTWMTIRNQTTHIHFLLVHEKRVQIYIFPFHQIAPYRHSIAAHLVEFRFLKYFIKTT